MLDPSTITALPSPCAQLIHIKVAVPDVGPSQMGYQLSAAHCKSFGTQIAKVTLPAGGAHFWLTIC